MNSKQMSWRMQSGMSIYVLMYLLITLGFVGFIGLKVFVPVLEYFSVAKVMSAIKLQEAQTGSVADIRKGFERRATIDDIKSVQPADLEITKEGNETIVSVAWSVKVPLFSVVSIVLDFEASTR